jgi:hypothetical protein
MVGNCGDAVTVTLRLQDGGADLGVAKLNLTLGESIPFIDFGENFDAVSTPALPPNWGISVTEGGSPWTTTTGTVDSQPNAAFVSDVEFAGSSEVISPTIPILSSSTRLTFQNNYNTEADTNFITAYDGGVLEIQIGSGSFVDIEDAGGSFLSGGYNLTLDPTGDNPLAGRKAWSGQSGGFINTAVALPPAAAKNSIRLKWKFGTDSGNFYGGSGWAIDSIVLEDFANSCCTSGVAPPSIVLQPTSQTVIAGTNVTFQVSADGTPPLSYQWNLNNSGLASETSSALVLTNVQPAQMGIYSVTVSNVAGWTNSTGARLRVLVAPTIAGISLSGSSISLTLESLSGLTYTLQYKNSLKDPNWLSLSAAVPGTGATITLTDSNPAAPSRFYRVLCE